MNDLLLFLNNNPFISDVFVLILSVLISTIVNNYFRNKEIKTNNRINRGEFRIEKLGKSENYNGVLRLVYSDIKLDYNDYSCEYSKNLFKEQKNRHLVFLFKNIGKSKIKEFHFVIEDREIGSIIYESDFSIKIKTRCPNYVISYRTPILSNESLLIRFICLKNSRLLSAISNISVYYMDQYENYYKQKVYFNSYATEGPYPVSEEEYIKTTNPVL